MGITNQRYTVNSTIIKTKVKMKFIVLAALAVVAVARPQYEAPSYPVVPPQYAREYAVQDEYAGVDFGANENREGYNTAGSYYVQLPDGRLQRVTYTVQGDDGFVADVAYEGEAQCPAAPLQTIRIELYR